MMFLYIQWTLLATDQTQLSARPVAQINFRKDLVVIIDFSDLTSLRNSANLINLCSKSILPVCIQYYRPSLKCSQVAGAHTAVSWEVFNLTNLSPFCQHSFCSLLRSLDFFSTRLSRPWTTSRTVLSFQGRQECPISISSQLTSRYFSPSGRSDLQHWPTGQWCQKCRGRCSTQ